MTSNGEYPFKVGRFKCTVITDGISHPKVSSLPDRFPAVSRQTLIQAIEKRNPDSETFEWSMNCLLVQTNDHNVLVDTGVGGDRGNLIPRLEDIIPLTDIDTVIITHCHPDHIGGLVGGDEGLSFPNADYFMRDEEWDYWMGKGGVVNQGDEEVANLLRSKLLPIQDRLTFVVQDREVVPGITAFGAFDHTPGHLGLFVQSEGETLLGLIDTLHAQVQLSHPGWSPRFDVDPHRAAQTRRKALSRAAEEGHPTLVYHFGFPGLGRISREGEGYRWEPWPGS